MIFVSSEIYDLFFHQGGGGGYPMHNVLFGSSMTLWYFGFSRRDTSSWENNIFGRKFDNLFRFSFYGTRNIFLKYGILKIGQNDP